MQMGRSVKTYVVGKTDDSVRGTALEEVIAVRAFICTHKLHVLRRRSWVAMCDLPPGSGCYVRDCGGGAPLRVRDRLCARGEVRMKTHELHRARRTRVGRQIP